MEIAALIVTAIGVIWIILFGSRSIQDIAIPKTSSIKALILKKDGVLQKYIDLVIRRHELLGFGDITRLEADDTTSSQGRIFLSKVYVPISVAIESAQQELDSRRLSRINEVNLSDLAASKKLNRIVILGKPGSGKSTALSIITLNEALKFKSEELSIENCRVPIHVHLSRVKFSQPPIWKDLLNGVGELAEITFEALEVEHTRFIWLLDGLDEVPSSDVALARGAISDLISSRHEETILVTCRTFDYIQGAPNRKLRLPACQIVPFRLEQALEYVDKWYDAVEEVTSFSDFEDRKRDLQTSLRTEPALAGLASVPLLLTLMVIVHSTEGALPTARALLYHRAISHLLAESPQWRSQYSGTRPSQSNLLHLASRIAFKYHLKEEEYGENLFLGLKYSDFEEIAEEHFNLDERLPSDQYIEKRNTILSHLARMIRSNGLLQEVGGGFYRFSHRSFQEFLAGYHFINGRDLSLARDLSLRAHWREAFILFAGYNAAQGLFLLLRMLEQWLGRLPTIDDPISRSAHLTLIGSMLAEIGRENFVYGGQQSAFDTADLAQDDGLWTAVQRAISSELEREEDSVQQRVGKLTVLGSLGDPRFLELGLKGRVKPPRWCSLAPIRMRIGDDAGSEINGSIRCSTRPARTITFPEFQIGTFPVTNLEYAEFIAAAGYLRKEFWHSSTGLAWLRGDSELRTDLEEQTRIAFERDFGPEIADSSFRREDIYREARAMAASRTRPFFWTSAPLSHPNAPVVGVNLWEACAYAAWLEAELLSKRLITSTKTVRLPTEWEWERAATFSPNGGPYPWGRDAPNGELAHFRNDGLEIRHATPVGVFARKLPPDFSQIQDLAGNVWEQTISKAIPYSPRFDRRRNELEGIDERIVKGGSWLTSNDAMLRCSYRQIDSPHHVYADLGFRLVLIEDY